MTVNIKAYVQDIINGIGGWKSYEDHEILISKDRDVAIAEWVIRCLANPDSQIAEDVLNAILERRQKAKEKQVLG